MNDLIFSSLLLKFGWFLTLHFSVLFVVCSKRLWSSASFYRNQSVIWPNASLKCPTWASLKDFHKFRAVTWLIGQVIFGFTVLSLNDRFMLGLWWRLDCKCLDYVALVLEFSMTELNADILFYLTWLTTCLYLSWMRLCSCAEQCLSDVAVVTTFLSILVFFLS